MNLLPYPRSTVLACLSLVSLIVGCGRSDTGDTPPTAPPKTADAAPAPSARNTDVPVANLDVSSALPQTEADKAWNELVRAMEPPPFPAEWQTKQPTPDQQRAFAATNGVLAAAAADQARAFYTKHAGDPRVAEAKEREHAALAAAAQLGNTNAAARLAALEEARLKDPSLPEEERLALRLEQIEREMSSETETNSPARLDALEKSIRALRKDFTNNAEVVGLLLAVAQGRLEQGQMDLARKLATEVADAVAEPDVQQAAQALLSTLKRVGQPLEIKFKAIDGRAVDVQTMRGKVVLVDFWATWCGPCVEELPKLKAAYEKFQSKGLEIVGISLDQNAAALERFVKKEKIPWPQHFDAGTGATGYADQFGIESIPTMWLVDKQGRLRDLNAREGLMERIEKLLAE